MAPNTEVCAMAPATVGNVACGFDVLGLALSGEGDRVVARLAGAPGVRISAIFGDGGRLPMEAEKNTAGIAAIETLRCAGIDVGVELELTKGLPLGSGLGSSAASAAASALAVNRLLGSPLRKSELIGPCLEAEAVVSGRHADNVAPALLGGFILVHSTDPLDVIRLPLPEGLTMAVVTPALEIQTKEARGVLPKRVTLEQMVVGTANLGGLVAACFSGDISLMSRCLVDDIVTPARAKLIPGAAEAMRAALEKGALGSSISGSGPSIFALCRSWRSAEGVGEAMQEVFASAGLDAVLRISPADSPGARVI